MACSPHRRTTRSPSTWLMTTRGAVPSLKGKVCCVMFSSLYVLLSADAVPFGKLLRENLYSLALFQVLQVEQAPARAIPDSAQHIFQRAVAQLGDQARPQAQADTQQIDRHGRGHLYFLLFRVEAAHANAQRAIPGPRAIHRSFALALALSFWFGLRQRVEQLRGLPGGDFARLDHAQNAVALLSQSGHATSSLQQASSLFNADLFRGQPLKDGPPVNTAIVFRRAAQRHHNFVQAATRRVVGDAQLGCQLLNVAPVLHQ